MKVSELIEKLKEVDPDLQVCFPDSEDGTQVVTELEEGIHYWSGGDKAKVLMFAGDSPYRIEYDEKYITRYVIPEGPQRKMHSLLNDYYKVTLDDQLKNQVILFHDNTPKPTEDGFVEFKIIKNRGEDD